MNFIIKICLIASTIIITIIANGQPPNIQWQKCLGGNSDDYSYSLIQTFDSSYVIAGSTKSTNGDVTGYHGGLNFGDVWLAKISNSGVLQWQKTFGGSGDEVCYSLMQTQDSGFIFTGLTDSNDGDVIGYHDSVDCWVVKTDSIGNLQWQKCLGGTSADRGYYVSQISEGGYVIGGYTQSMDGDAIGNNGNGNYWIVKLDNSGVLQWQKSYGAGNSGGGSLLKFVKEISGGGFIAIGQTYANDGDVSGNHSAELDIWVIRIDSVGNLIWQKCFGGTYEESGASFLEINDEGFILAGYTASDNDGDVTGNHAGGGSDFWIVKIDSSGNLQWQRCFGGSWDEEGKSIVQAADSSYVILGTATSNDGDVSGIHNGTLFRDFWLIKLDINGNLQWQKCFGGTNNDVGNSLIQTMDGGYAMAGFTHSNNGDVSGNHNVNDFWLVKLAPPIGADVQDIQEEAFTVFPNPANNKLEIKSAFAENGMKEIDKVTVCSFAGQTLLQSQHGGTSIEMDVQDLAAGMYLLCIHTSQGITTQKFIKE